jgi:uncharacterized protein YndB with AHSA1/START domain
VADRGSSGNAASTGEYLETPKGQGGSDSVETAGARQALPLRISRAFPAPRALLFRAWSSSDHIERWFSPKNYTVQVAWVQMRVGGQFDVCMRGPYGGERIIKGTFVEVIPYNRLVIEMRVVDWEGKPLFKARTEVTFADDVIGARMDLVQTDAVVDQAMAAPTLWGVSEGWRTTLDKLQKEVTRMVTARGGLSA